jgi:hypothetical protein
MSFSLLPIIGTETEVDMVKVTKANWMRLAVATFAMFAMAWLLSSEAIAAMGYTNMPYKFKDVENGDIHSGTYNFANTAYFPTGEGYCTENHRDPDGNKYGHSHLPVGFPLTITFNGNPNYQVTVTKSNWAWNDIYAGYTPAGDSTFALNCFAYAVNAPTVTFYDGWCAFTNIVPFVSATTMATTSHAIKIGTEETPDEYLCAPHDPVYVCSTDEKNASGGTYTKSWDYPGRSYGAFTLGCQK